MTEETIDENDQPAKTKDIEIAHLGENKDGRTAVDKFAVRSHVFAFDDIEPFSMMLSDGGEASDAIRCAIKLKSGETVLVPEDIYRQFMEWFEEHQSEKTTDDDSPAAQVRVLICQAIEEKRLIQFSYDDLTRIVEPHIFGRKTSGNDVLGAWLVEGYTESDHDPYWRNYTIENMDFIILLEEKFELAREGFNPDDKTYEKIYCRLQ